MSHNFDIAVVGAGAAGLASAIFAAQDAQTLNLHPAIVLLDSAKKPGAKILVSGGGRCNVTHHRVQVCDFHGATNIIRKILAQFSVEDAVAWFADMGVTLKQEKTGKLFPITNRADTVLHALLNRCDQLGVVLLAGHPVHAIKKQEDGFTIEHAAGCLRARCVIMATGGKSLPKTGSDGSGWIIAQTLGHAITPTFPALVPLFLDDHDASFHASLAGVSHEAELSTFVAGKRIDRRAGSLLWTHVGVSGPVVMDASRFWTGAKQVGQPVQLRCNFLPGRSFDEVEQQLIEVGKGQPCTTLSTWLAPYTPRRIADALLNHLNIPADQTAGQLPRDQRRSLAHALVELPLAVKRDRGWNYAEVTAGGVPLDEIDSRTMMSRKVSGLYLVGEMLDCDGRIGGFNFHWAWATGRLAGRTAVKH